jgi:hypothetical protein
MFIDSADDNTHPPSGGPCAGASTSFEMPMTHRPPDGGPPCFHLASINIALLTEGRLFGQKPVVDSQRPPSGGLCL